MKTDVTLKIAGAAGQGIQTIGDLLSDVCHQSGLFTFSVDDYESRVRAGTILTCCESVIRNLPRPATGLISLSALTRMTMIL